MNKHYNCIIIDDEPKAIALLADSLHEFYPNLKVEDTYTSWLPALTALRDKHFDILFMDISMPGKNGIDILRLLPNIESEIIFVTAHSEFALDAIKFETSGYLLKPFEDPEFVSAVDRAIERCRIKKAAKQNSHTGHAINAKMGIPNNKGIDYVNINDILYFETINKYTDVVLKDQKILSSYNLGKFKDLVEGFSFYQVHRSYIINLNCVKRFETSGVITMADNKEIPISRSLKDEFLHLFATVTKTSGLKRDGI